MDEVLQEYCDSRGVSLRVNGQSGILRGVKILGLESRNGRRYRTQALAEAIDLYEGAKVNVNQPKTGPLTPLDYQERIGVIRNVVVRPGEGLFADFHFNPKHALAEQLVWDAEHAPENVGFSHNVQARTTRRGREVVVEAITKVQSVDLVADPATTRGLFESQPAVDDAQRPSKTASLHCVDDLRREYPELVEALCAEQTEQIESLRAEVERLTASEAVGQKKLLIRRLLREYQLPDPDTANPQDQSIVGERFLQSLLATEDDQAIRELVEERAALVRSLGGAELLRSPVHRKPRSRDQHPTDAIGGLDTVAFIDAIT